VKNQVFKENHIMDLLS